jgi:hypothetical protein
MQAVELLANLATNTEYTNGVFKLYNWNMLQVWGGPGFYFYSILLYCTVLY